MTIRSVNESIINSTFIIIIINNNNNNTNIIPK